MCDERSSQGLEATLLLQHPTCQCGRARTRAHVLGVRQADGSKSSEQPACRLLQLCASQLSLHLPHHILDQCAETLFHASRLRATEQMSKIVTN